MSTNISSRVAKLGQDRVYANLVDTLGNSVLRLDLPISSSTVPETQKQKSIKKIMSLLHIPHKLEDERIVQAMPEEVAVAKNILAKVDGGMGVYVDPEGQAYTRTAIAEMIEKRDGFPIDIDQLCLGTALSMNAVNFIEVVGDGEQDSIAVQTPANPDFLAGCRLAGVQIKEWSCIDELESIMKETEKLKLVCLTNPSDPEGRVICRDGMTRIMKLAVEHRVMLLIDETNSEQQFDGRFVHARVVAKDAGLLDTLEFAVIDSMNKHDVCPQQMSVSWLEVYNVNPYVISLMIEYNGSAEIQTSCQALTYLCCTAEHDIAPARDIIKKTHEFVKNMDKVTVRDLEGSYLLYPTVSVSDEFVAEAKAAGIAASELYAKKLAEAVGVLVVPAAEFEPSGEKTCSFRMAANVELSADICEKWNAFHTTL